MASMLTPSTWPYFLERIQLFTEGTVQQIYRDFEQVKTNSKHSRGRPELIIQE